MSSRFSRGVDFDVGGLRQMGRWRWISLVQNPDLSVDLIPKPATHVFNFPCTQYIPA